MTKKYVNFVDKILKKEMNIIDNYFRYQEYLSSIQYNERPPILTPKKFNLTKKKMEFVKKLYKTTDIMDNMLELNPRAVIEYMYDKKSNIHGILELLLTIANKKIFLSNFKR